MTGAEAKAVKVLTRNPAWAIVKRELQLHILRVVREQGESVAVKTIDRKGGESIGMIRCLDFLEGLGMNDTEGTDGEE